MRSKFFKKFFEKGGETMNLINLKWMITIVIVITLVDFIVRKIKKNKKK